MIKNIRDAQIKREQLKEQRLAKLISDDYRGVLKVLDLAISALGHYKKYTPVMEVLSSIQTNKTLFEIKLKKYERQMEEYEKNKLEKT